MYQLLLSGSLRYTAAQMEQITRLGFTIHHFPDEKKAFDFDASVIDAAVCSQLPAYHDMSSFCNLKFIQILSAGFDRFPVEDIKRRGIQIANAKGVYSIPIAEWIVLKILEIYKQTRFFEQAYAEHKWAKNRDMLELTDKTAVIFGTGSIGIEAAKRLRAFGVEVIGVNTHGTASPQFDKVYSSDNWSQCLSKGDILISTLPLSVKTARYFDRDRFNSMKDGAVFLNISRGGVVDETSLISAIQSGKFRGVALDVFETEPLPPDSPLWNFGNVLITPHNSFASELTAERTFKLILQNLTAFVNGETYVNLI